MTKHRYVVYQHQSQGCSVRGERLTDVKSRLRHTKREYSGLRAMKEVMLLLERWYPGSLSKMSLFFKIEFIATICFHHGKEVTGLINAWGQSRTRTPEQKTRLESMWIESRQIAIERGVKKAFARCFQDINGTIWERKDNTWVPLDTRWPAYDLSMWFIYDIVYQKDMLEKWQKCANTSDQDLHLL